MTYCQHRILINTATNSCGWVLHTYCQLADDVTGVTVTGVHHQTIFVIEIVIEFFRRSSALSEKF